MMIENERAAMVKLRSEHPRIDGEPRCTAPSSSKRDNVTPTATVVEGKPAERSSRNSVIFKAFV